MTIAAEWLTQLLSGEYDECASRLDETMAKAMEAQGGLAAVVDSITISAGAVKSYGTATAATSGGYLVVTIPVTFENAVLNAEIALNDGDLVLGLFFRPGQAADAEKTDRRVTLALDWLKAFLSGEYEETGAMLSDEMTSALAAQGGLQEFGETLAQQMGAVKEYGEASASVADAFVTITLPVTFDAATLDVAISVDAKDKIAGFAFQPQIEVADIVIPENVLEEEIALDAGTGYPLGGTLSLPKDAQQPLPAVLLVSGSGANPRDEIVGANRVFAQLAHGLSSRGLITLRFDKRTFTYPDLWNEEGFSVKHEYVEDVLAAVNLLKADPRVDPQRVYIAGHSQGGMLAPRFVEEGADVAGLVLLAGTPRSLSDLLYDQQRLTAEQSGVPNAYMETWKQDAAALYAMTPEQALKAEPLYAGTFPAYYLYEMHGHDALKLLQAQKTPVLVMQGGKDVQVYADVDYKLYQEALEGAAYARFHLYPDLSHIFMPSSATTMNAALVEYNTPSSIPDEVFEDIVDFISNTPGK